MAQPNQARWRSRLRPRLLLPAFIQFLTRRQPITMPGRPNILIRIIHIIIRILITPIIIHTIIPIGGQPSIGDGAEVIVIPTTGAEAIGVEVTGMAADIMFHRVGVIMAAATVVVAAGRAVAIVEEAAQSWAAAVVVSVEGRAAAACQWVAVVVSMAVWVVVIAKPAAVLKTFHAPISAGGQGLG